MMGEREFFDAGWETVSPDERTALQLRRLKRFLIYVNERNLFYRKRFQEAGFTPRGIRTLEDLLDRLPSVDKTSLMDEQARKPPFGDLLTDDSQRLVRLY